MTQHHPVKRPFPRYLALCIGLVLIASVTSTPGLAQTPTGAIVDDPAQLEPGEVMRIEDGEIHQLAFSPDEAILAVATSAGLWLYAPNQESNGELLDEAPVDALWWAADSNLLAALLDDGALHIWQVADRTRLTTIESGASAFASVAWSPDASQIAIGTADGTIGIWDVAGGTVLETLEGHTDAINALYWIADGSQIISASADGSIRVWAVEVAVTVRPQQATPTPASEAAGSATVAVETLNVRAGPSTTFERIGQVKQGEELTVIGQVNSCAWLQVSTTAIPRGWVAGGAQFVTLETSCALIPPPSTPSALTATPTSAAPPQAEEEPLPTLTPVDEAQPSPTPPPPPAPEQPAQPTAAPVDPYPADQGCYLFQNQLGPELTITFTKTDGTFNETFPVPAGQEVPHCFTPGSYTYTIDAPPPWADINGTLDVQAGARFMFPIRPQ